MRVVLDTNILARTVLNPSGSAGEVFRLLSEPTHTLVLSIPQLSELARTLAYPRLSALHGWTEQELDSFLANLQQSAFVVVPAELPEGGVVPADVEDNVIVAAAVAGQADVLCTLDRHFQHVDVQQFCSSHGIRIVSDVELLTVLRGGEVGP